MQGQERQTRLLLQKLMVHGLARWKRWTVVSNNGISEDGIVISRRFLNTLKNCGTPTDKAKVRYVAQGHNEKAKPFIVHGTETLKHSQSISFIPGQLLKTYVFSLMTSSKRICKANICSPARY